MATLYGLGVGPGDPDLITIKAARILQHASVIAFPAPLSGESLARSIAAPHIPAGRIELPFAIDITAPHAANEQRYDTAARAIGDHLAAGRDVAVLCEGDPFLYGSFMYLFTRLAARWPVTVVPGVSSLTAAAATLHRPLVSGNETLAVLPATLPAESLAARLAACDAAAVLKVGRHFAKLKRVIAEAGLMHKAEVIERIGFADQRRRPLDAVAEEAVPYFSIVLIRRDAKDHPR
jgi:precorrin-2/cobalt-factor-2 C20-methyltransferase